MKNIHCLKSVQVKTKIYINVNKECRDVVTCTLFNLRQTAHKIRVESWKNSPLKYAKVDCSIFTNLVIKYSLQNTLGKKTDKVEHSKQNK